MIAKVRSLFEDPLYRNSIYLILSSVILSGLGFFFWTIAARIFSSTDVGLATTLVSAMSLLVSLSNIGLGVAMIRFLPTSDDKNTKINTCFTVAIFTSVVVSAIFLLGIKIFSPKLVFIQNLHYGLLFILFTCSYLFFNLVESVFLGFRHARTIVVKNTIYSFLKLALLFLFVGFGSFGILGSWGFAALFSVGFSMYILTKRFFYKPKFVISNSVIKKIASYSFGNYLASFFWGAPELILPLIITEKLGASLTAYYYIPMMIAGLLFVIPTAVSQSFLAEGSHEMDVKLSLKKSVEIISLLLIPSILVFVFLGSFILRIFGNEYSENGSLLLSILAVSSVFVAVKSVYISLLNIRKEVKKIVILNFLTFALVIALSLFLLDYGLVGVGLAWFIGQALSLIFIPLAR